MAKKKSSTAKTAKPKCGLVMPISAIDGCSEQHWSDVKGIITDAIEDAGFDVNLVSDADDVGIIQKRIIQNLYDNPIVVCDVSGKNPNVMFELGMRLAFDKPTIIIKDDNTSYSFDTSPIEHLEYPRDLRYSQIIEFKDELNRKVKATHKRATEDPSYTTFLKHFGTFTVAQLDSKEIPREDFVLEELRDVKRMLSRRQPDSLDSERECSLSQINVMAAWIVEAKSELVKRGVQATRDIVLHYIAQNYNLDASFASRSQFHSVFARAWRMESD